MGVCAALIFNGILGYVRDYVINFISTSIEARLSGDIFDKVMAMPASTFQTGSGFGWHQDSPYWVHVSYISESENRGRALKAVREDGKTNYQVI